MDENEYKYTGYISQRETILVCAYSDNEAFELFKNNVRNRERIPADATAQNWYRKKYTPTGKFNTISGYQYLTFGEDGGLDAEAEYVEAPTRTYFITDILKDLEANPV